MDSRHPGPGIITGILTVERRDHVRPERDLAGGRPYPLCYPVVKCLGEGNRGRQADIHNRDPGILQRGSPRSPASTIFSRIFASSFGRRSRSPGRPLSDGSQNVPGRAISASRRARQVASETAAKSRSSPGRGIIRCEKTNSIIVSIGVNRKKEWIMARACQLQPER